VEEQQHQEHIWTDRTGGDIPSGYRPCPFCRAVIPWGSERCPSCGRVLVERSIPGAAQTGPSRQQAARLTWWARVGAPALRRMRTSVQSWWGRTRRTSETPWNTTSRGTSWSVFRPVAPTRSWWHGLVPAPTPQERRILLTVAALMVGLLLVALVLR